MDLNLPRILCLHGGGTNARIFKIQCRVLERALHYRVRFIYAEAPFLSKPGPDVTSVYSKMGPFKAWLRTHPEDQIQSPEHVVDCIETALLAAMCMDDLLGARGEWIGILGFSQGAKLAASILHTQQYDRRYGRTPILPVFRFAVLLAGRGPLVWLLPELPMPDGLVSADHLSTCTKDVHLPLGKKDHILSTPTLHVHGVNDPGLGLHRKLCHRYCDPKSVAILEWEGTHRVMIKKADVEPVVDQVHRLIDQTYR